MTKNENKWRSLKQYFTSYDEIQLNSERYKSMLKFHINQTPKKSFVFDAGAGTGILSKKLLNKGNKVISVDINQNALNFLKDKTKNNNSIEIYKIDLSKKYTLKVKADIAHSMIVLPFPNNIDVYLQNLYDNLRINGKVVISAWNCVEDIYTGAILMLETELKEKKIFSKKETYETWKNVKKNGKFFAQEILNRKLSKKKLSQKLENIGFKEITHFEGIYNNKYTYHIVAIK